MAKLSSDGTYVTVEKGDTLYAIARDYGNGKTYQQLAAINNISNPNLIYVGQVIKLTNDGGSSSSSSNSNSSKATIKQFGLQSNADDVLFATWTWNVSNTESYKVLWTYDTGDGVWFDGNNSTITVNEDSQEMARQSTYTIPSNAHRVRFKVKPISKKKKENNKETSYWEAKWSDVKTYTKKDTLATPPVPEVEIDRYTLTATLDNLKDNQGSPSISDQTIEFEIVKDNYQRPFKRGRAQIMTGHASYSCTIDVGSEYKVRCRACAGIEYSEWSAYSENMETLPAPPYAITTIKATSKTSVYLEWRAVTNADSYDIEYATKKTYFDGSDQTTIKNGIKTAHFELTGLETGSEYFFRVRAVNKANEASEWCGIKSVRIGDEPAAPTTWSSTTTAIVGEELNLYWVHNASDGSSQTYAELELTIGDSIETYTIKNNRDEDELDKPGVYQIHTTDYPAGTKISWRVRTAGVTLTYGEWSVQRTVDIYAPPTLDLSLTDSNGVHLDTVTTFPIYIRGLAGPNTQAPIGYHVTIESNEIYETVDNIGNPKMINSGEMIYSNHLDMGYSHQPLELILSAGNIDLENNISYTMKCVVSMDSGLTSEASLIFNVTWDDKFYEPNAEISVDPENYTASIRPYCLKRNVINTIVTIEDDGTYTFGESSVGNVYGEVVPGAKTSSGLQVYFGTDADGNEVHFCKTEFTSVVEDVLLSVYRREFDGSFTELATNLDNSKFTTITDPHPSLDYARYRIVATSKTTGAVSFYDLPGYPVGGISAIIQWDEEWSSFETSEESALEQPPWVGSMLKLPYNIDISDSSSPDVALIEYTGRSHPVAYYGTQRGSMSNWNMVIDKNDKETLYALRRLANWMGNVYVREPSGSGYWASVKVSFSQKHRDLIIPVTLNISRVEGGA